jgi:predicted Zn-dependent protease
MNTGAAVQMRLQRAQALAQQGDLPGALAVLEQATPGERAGVQSFQVDLLKALDRKEEALVIRRAQAAAMPGSVVAQHNLASSLGDTGRNLEAVEAARRAFANGGDAPETWLVLARALSGCGRHDEADDAYRQALEASARLWRRRAGAGATGSGCAAEVVRLRRRRCWMRSSSPQTTPNC